MTKIKVMIKNIVKRIIYGKYYKWYAQLNKIRSEYQKKYYSRQAPQATNKKYMVVCMFDGRCHHGGLSDRLRGITTIYQACKELGIDFRINFTSPFDIEKIFCPNRVDWRIETDEMSYNIDDAVPCNIIDATYKYPHDLQKQFIKEIIISNNKKYRQLHIYCNAGVTHQDGSFSALFKELFVLSDNIKIELEKSTKLIGQDYICVATRFCSLLGDFEDVNMGELTESQQEDLITRCVAQLEKIHAQYPDKCILVTSDSSRFSDRVSKLDFAYSIEGKREHLDRTDVHDFDLLKGSVIDFLLISRATSIFQIKSKEMYSGAFSKSASYLNNIPFELVEF